MTDILQRLYSIPYIWLYLLGGMMLFSLVRGFFDKDKKIALVLDIISYSCAIALLVLAVSKMYITRSLPTQWEIVVAIGFFILQKFGPPLVRWYDKKVDKMVDSSVK